MMQRTRSYFLHACLAGLSFLGLQNARAADATPEQLDFFEKQVRPILETSCVKCHGGEKTKADFKITSRTGILAGGTTGPAYNEKEPEKSLLLDMISYRDDDHKMPPKQKLAPEQIETLTKWVKSGLAWKLKAGETEPVPEKKEPPKEISADWWAYKKCTRPDVPAVKNAAWVKNPIDAFILSKLEKNSLTPAPAADKGALLRRAYYDLTGLPPKLEEVSAFIADKDPQAFEKVIDKLLASPQYGEKWGRHWLDLVRFAETNGYERDGKKPNAWKYRDYVIKSFNTDKPYDRFLQEQLAGDEMFPGDTDALTGTGYYRLGIWDDEPADREQASYDVLDGILATTGNAMLATTIGCARCHDHKKDPIPQADYYRMLAFFTSIKPMQTTGPNIEIPVSRDEAAHKAFHEKLNKLQAEKDAIEAEFTAKSGPAGKAIGGPSIEDLTYKFYRDSFKQLPEFDKLHAESEGKLPAGYFDLAPATRKDEFGFVYTGMLVVPKDGKYTFSLDSDDGSRLIVDGKKIVEYDGIHGTGNPQTASVDLKAGRLPIRLEYFQGVFGLGLIVEWSSADMPSRMLSAPFKDENGKKQDKSVADAIKNRGLPVIGKEKVERYKEVSKSLEETKKNPPKDETVLGVTENGSPADTWILKRGNPHVQGDKVEPGFLKVLTTAAPEIKPLPNGKGLGRRTALAKWITSPDNQLATRAIANRLWQFHFGRGIVRSSNDFGRLGELPTHPELLDWLANEVVAKEWKLKAMHKLIMLSNAYQMSCKDNEAALAKDGGNDLFWRFDMRRLSAEEIRDTILATNGTLNLKSGGPSIYTEVPDEVLQTSSQPNNVWGKSPPEEQVRRSVYILVKRSLVEPIMSAFDVADTDSSCPARFTTTVPTQSLTSLNSKFFNNEAAKFAARLRKEAGAETGSQIRLAFQSALLRPATDKEVKKSTDLIETLQKADKQSPEQALNNFCLMMLNLNEFIYLE